jgi:hypothetical protein
MTTVHPRRALAEAEAAAWLELHADWCRGLPAEVRDTSVIGTETASGDGRSLPWYRMDGAFTGSPAPMGYVPQGLSDWAPGWETRLRSTRPDPASAHVTAEQIREWDTHQAPALAARPERSPEGTAGRRDRSTWGESAASASITDAPAAGEPMPLRGRALRAVGRQGTEQLRDVTVTLGQRVPASLRYDRRVDGTRRAGVTQAYPDLDRLGIDTSWMDRLASAELLEWLRLEARLTDRELEALQQRAAGVAQSDRSGATLARAQRRALAAMA